MATLAESFLADLEELSDDEEGVKSENDDKMDEDELDKVRDRPTRLPHQQLCRALCKRLVRYSMFLGQLCICLQLQQSMTLVHAPYATVHLFMVNSSCHMHKHLQHRHPHVAPAINACKPSMSLLHATRYSPPRTHPQQ